MLSASRGQSLSGPFPGKHVWHVLRALQFSQNVASGPRVTEILRLPWKILNRKNLNCSGLKLSENTGLFRILLHWACNVCHMLLPPSPLGLSCLTNRQLPGVECGIVNCEGWLACQPVWLEPGCWRRLTAAPFTWCAASTWIPLIKRRVTSKHQKHQQPEILKYLPLVSFFTSASGSFQIVFSFFNL